MSSSGLHGQKREHQTEEQKRIKFEAEKEQIKEYNDLDLLLLQNRKDREHTDEALVRTTKMLSINPEYYSIWNYRREILSSLFQNMDSEERQAILKQDISLIDSLLLRAPKSYWVWNHRRWVLDNMPVKQYDKELKIINYMLDLDSRNFHGWDYRRYIIGMNVSTPEKEFEYTNLKIKQNFSNYSAWHYRSKIMPLVFKGEELKAQIKQDIELVRDAMVKMKEGVKISNRLYICSDLQILQLDKNQEYIEFEEGAFVGSQLNLVSSKISVSTKEITQDYKEIPFNSEPLLEELPILKELLELEPDAKWVLLGILYIYTTLGIELQESVKLLDHLMTIDKKRIKYYKEKKASLLLKHEDFQDERVVLSSNCLSNLPKPHLFVFTRYLDLSNNDLQTLSFLKYLSLKELNLDSNQLTNISGIQTQKQLEKLSVKNNKIVKSGLSDLMNLKLNSLVLDGNPLTDQDISHILGVVLK
ncbi:hypothetical protein HK103_006304 [Boothiomyces macroporosus]|uniref:Geranylgeranyl transferase type-2 subunit alpha n=1 Tax=Boothiomyces macroporosus TaxID=261099 RepID=A0AAD5UH23_9FUNG|nr:hypothetical protein HK103_006304 [Boothiomyces macroporosus]